MYKREIIEMNSIMQVMNDHLSQLIISSIERFALNNASGFNGLRISRSIFDNVSRGLEFSINFEAHQILSGTIQLIESIILGDPSGDEIVNIIDILLIL